MKKRPLINSSFSQPSKLSDEDRRLWHLFTREIKPLAQKKKPIIQAAPLAKPNVLPASQPALPVMKQALTAEESLLYRGRRRLKRPNVHARLDLHGLTQTQAQQTLESFILQAYESRYGCVFVITGKGKSNTDAWWERVGVLREAVPRWLNAEPNRSRIITFNPARPDDGGSGSLYVYLKRK